MPVKPVGRDSVAAGGNTGDESKAIASDHAPGPTLLRRLETVCSLQLSLAFHAAKQISWCKWVKETLEDKGLSNMPHEMWAIFCINRRVVHSTSQPQVKPYMSGCGKCEFHQKNRTAKTLQTAHFARNILCFGSTSCIRSTALGANAGPHLSDSSCTNWFGAFPRKEKFRIIEWVFSSEICVKHNRQKTQLPKKHDFKFGPVSLLRCIAFCRWNANW